MKYSKKEIEALTNWDRNLSKKPFKTLGEERQYYGRFLQERLWKYLKKNDWKRLSLIIDSIKIPDRTKDATKFLLKKKKFA